MQLNIENGLIIDVDGVSLTANLVVPKEAKGLVIFSHGSGSSRYSPRNKYVAGVLNKKGIGTLLIDLLTPKEDSIYNNRFDIGLLTRRLIAITQYMYNKPATFHMPIGYFGASTGAASALNAAEELNTIINAIVSRGGRPDMADVSRLEEIKAPTLLIVGSLDFEVYQMNQAVFEKLKCRKKLELINGATHLFEEKGKLEEVANVACEWFDRFLVKEPAKIDLL